jgi:hypothetical protein
LENRKLENWRKKSKVYSKRDTKEPSSWKRITHITGYRAAVVSFEMERRGSRQQKRFEDSRKPKPKSWKSVEL